MPYLRLQTNVAAPTPGVADRASRLVAELTGKPEAWVMIALEPATVMRFGGTDAPAAFLHLKSIGLPADLPSLSRALCDFVTRELGVPGERIYVEMTDAPGARWGWNGETFEGE